MSDLALYLALNQRVDKLEEMIMSARDDLAAVGAQLNKALTELTTAINDGTVTEADLAPVKAAAQALDDLVPDAPEEPPVEPPV